MKMSYLSIDRFEENIAVCEDEHGKRVLLQKQELPKDAKEGDCIILNANGKYEIDVSLTNELRQKAIKLQNSLWDD